MKRITDLEQFALEEVWRPYQNMMGHEKRLDSLPVDLEETARLLIVDDTGWSKRVLDRIATVGFTFPDYIHHPLVDVIKVHSICKPGDPDGTLSSHETRGGAGDDCSVGKRGVWPPDGSDGVAAGERRPEPSVTGGESAATSTAVSAQEPCEDTSIGGITWHSSEEDGGPDVGISVYLGNERRLWCGEISNALYNDQGAEHFESAGGWFLIDYNPEPTLVAKFGDELVAREFVEQVAAFVTQPNATQFEAAAAGPTVEQVSRRQQLTAFAGGHNDC